MGKPNPEGRERPGNIPLTALLGRLRKALKYSKDRFDAGDLENAESWLNQAIAILEGKDIW